VQDRAIRQKGSIIARKFAACNTAKHAMLYKHKVHDAEAYVFYMESAPAEKDTTNFVAAL